jgi:hypothetical protein
MPATRSTSRHLSANARRAMLAVSMLAVSLLAVMSACGRFRHGDDEPAMQAQVVFVNESLDQADVFAAAPGGESVRMGTVQAGRTETLNVPSQFVSRASVTIVVRLLSRSGALRTGPIAINAGDRVEVRLPVNGNVLSVLPAR